jgi:phytoene/squalene synthetase
VIDLDREFLAIEALGDYARAKALMEKYVVIRPDVQKALDKMKALPNDIRPAFVTATALTAGGQRSEFADQFDHLQRRRAISKSNLTKSYEVLL